MSRFSKPWSTVCSNLYQRTNIPALINKDNVLQNITCKTLKKMLRSFEHTTHTHDFYHFDDFICVAFNDPNPLQFLVHFPSDHKIHLTAYVLLLIRYRSVYFYSMANPMSLLQSLALRWHHTAHEKWTDEREVCLAVCRHIVFSNPFDGLRCNLVVLKWFLSINYIRFD
jgi:hypothetical protein